MHTRKIGQFFGETRRQETASGLILSENRYFPGQCTPRHIHEAMLFYSVLNGVCNEQIKKNTTAHALSTLVFLPTGEAHSTQWSSDTEGHCFHLEINQTFLTSRLERESTYSQTGPLSYCDGPPPMQMRRLYREFLRWDHHSPMIAEGMVLELFGECGRSHTSRTARPERWLAMVETRLREQPEMPPTLVELASMADVHPSHLTRAFRQRYHATPGEFVRTLRIEEACRRLRGGHDLSLSTLAQELGFSDQSHFIRTFRSILGITPGAYRKIHCL